MSEETAEVQQPEAHFSNQDLNQFGEDDVTAGRAIGKLLSFFFLYTVLAMSIVGIWTWMTVAG